jgi:hypothetical protein
MGVTSAAERKVSIAVSKARGRKSCGSCQKTARNAELRDASSVSTRQDRDDTTRIPAPFPARSPGTRTACQLPTRLRTVHGGPGAVERRFPATGTVGRTAGRTAEHHFPQPH